MIILRDYTLDDADQLVELANNENVSRYLIDTFPHPYTRADAEWWITIGSKENGAITRVIEWQEKFIGSIGLHPQTGWRRHTAEIGYWIGEPYWDYGLASRAVDLMTTEARTKHGIERLYAPVLAPNLASMRVLEKNEYVLEGVMRSDVQKNGTYYDIHYYAKNYL